MDVLSAPRWFMERPSATEINTIASTAELEENVEIMLDGTALSTTPNGLEPDLPAIFCGAFYHLKQLCPFEQNHIPVTALLYCQRTL